MDYDVYGRIRTCEDEKVEDIVDRVTEELAKYRATAFEWTGIEGLKTPLKPFLEPGGIYLPSEEEKAKFGLLECVLEGGRRFVLSLEPWKAEYWSISGGMLWYMGDCKGRIQIISGVWSLK